MPYEPTPWLTRLRFVALGIAMALALCLAAEAFMRMFYPVAPVPGLDHFLVKARSFLVPCREPVPGARPRIAVLGESSGAFLAQAMRKFEGRPDAAFSVLECAVGASGFDYLQRTFSDALQLNPDALVIVFGHNYAFRYPTTFWEFLPLEIRARSHLARALLDLAGTRIVIDGYPGPRPPADQLRVFLQTAAAQARARNVRVVLSTVTPNLLLPPTAGEPLHETVRRQILAARMLRARGERHAARQRLAAAERAASTAEIQFELGLWATVDEDQDTARIALQRALELDRRNARVTTEVNDVVRAVAREEGLLLRDAERVRREMQPDGVTGWETLYDNCHLREELFTAEALAILELLEIPTAPLRDRQDTQPAADVSQHAVMVLDGLRGAYRDGVHPGDGTPGVLTVAIWRLLQTGDPAIATLIDAWPERQPALSPRAGAVWFAAAAEAYALAGNPQRATALNARALDLDPTSSQAWVWRALYQVAMGEGAQARESLQQAASYSGSQEAQLYLEMLN